jgi:hypothetical protein
MSLRVELMKEYVVKNSHGRSLMDYPLAVEKVTISKKDAVFALDSLFSVSFLTILSLQFILNVDGCMAEYLVELLRDSESSSRWLGE